MCHGEPSVERAEFNLARVKVKPASNDRSSDSIDLAPSSGRIRIESFARDLALRNSQPSERQRTEISKFQIGTNREAAWFDTKRSAPNNAGVSKGEIVRRIKTYSAANGFVYQYQFHQIRPGKIDGAGGMEYIYYVTADRKTMFPARVFLQQEALQKWSSATGRTLNGTEQYAVAKMRLFQGFDEVDDFAQTRPVLVVDETNINGLLGQLDL